MYLFFNMYLQGEIDNKIVRVLVYVFLYSIYVLCAIIIHMLTIKIVTGIPTYLKNGIW